MTKSANALAMASKPPAMMKRKTRSIPLNDEGGSTFLYERSGVNRKRPLPAGVGTGPHWQAATSREMVSYIRLVPGPDSCLISRRVGLEMLVLDRLLRKSAMTAEEIGRLRKAYELALREIGVEDRDDDPLTERVAKEIVKAGQAGLTDPAEIASLVVKRYLRLGR